jgi:hypothetical protein
MAFDLDNGAVERAGGSRVPPEDLLVWAVRAIAWRREKCPSLWSAFSDRLGADGAKALAACYVLVRTAEIHRRRPISVYSEGFPQTTFDELQLLGVVAAAQQPDGMSAQALASRLRFLVRREPSDTLTSSAYELASLFARHCEPLRVQPVAAGSVPWTPAERVH